MQKQNFIEDAPFFHIERGPGPLVAAMIRDGHEIRAELDELFALDEGGRLRRAMESYSASRPTYPLKYHIGLPEEITAHP